MSNRGFLENCFSQLSGPPAGGNFPDFSKIGRNLSQKGSPFYSSLSFHLHQFPRCFTKCFTKILRSFFQEKSGKIWSFLPPTPPNFEIFLIDKKSTVCYRKLHFLWKVGLGGSIGEDGISFFQFFEKKLTILIHRAQKSMVFSRKMGSKKWVKFNKK